MFIQPGSLLAVIMSQYVSLVEQNARAEVGQGWKDIERRYEAFAPLDVLTC